MCKTSKILSSKGGERNMRCDICNAKIETDYVYKNPSGMVFCEECYTKATANMPKKQRR